MSCFYSFFPSLLFSPPLPREFAIRHSPSQHKNVHRSKTRRASLNQSVSQSVKVCDVRGVMRTQTKVLVGFLPQLCESQTIFPPCNTHIYIFFSRSCPSNRPHSGRLNSLRADASLLGNALLRRSKGIFALLCTASCNSQALYRALYATSRYSCRSRCRPRSYATSRSGSSCRTRSRS